MDQRGRPQHLAHAGAPLGPFVADHYHLAFPVGAGADHRGTFFFALEHARRPFVLEAREACNLDEGAVRREVALEHDDAAARRDRLIGCADDVAVRVWRAGAGLRQRRSGNGRRVAVQMAMGDERLHDGAHAPDRLDILRVVFAARLQVADQRRALEYRGHVVESEADAGFVRERGDVQRGVGRAAGGRDNGAGILQAPARHQVARQRAAAPQDLHDQRAGLPGDGRARGVDRRQHGRARRRETENLGHHPHGVGGELPGAGPDGRHARALERIELGPRHLPGHDRTGRLIGGQHRDRLAAPAAGKGAATEDEDRRQVAADHGHHDPRQVFVAAAEAD